MALEEFEAPEMNERQKGFVRMRSIMDFGMGILWIAMGVFLLFVEKFSEVLAEKYGDNAFKIFGAVCVIYGLFRIYRGVKKDYFVEK